MIDSEILQPDLPPPRRPRPAGAPKPKPRPCPKLEKEPERKRTPQIVSAAALLADEDCLPPPEIIKGVLHQGSRLVLGGHSKSYKSYLLLDAALSVQAGKPFLGWPTERGRVLYINLELADWSIKRRIAAVAKARAIADVSGLDLLNLRGWEGEALEELLIMRTRGRAYSLCVLDPVYRLLSGMDENSAGTVTRITGQLAELAENTSGALMYAAHYAKGNAAGKEAIDRVAGSGVWLRDADAAILLTKHKAEARRAYTVDIILRDLPEQESFVLEWKHPLMARAKDLDPEDLKRIGGRKPEHTITDLLNLLPDGGLDGNGWMAAATEKGMSRATYYRLRGQAAAGQLAEEMESGKWARIS